MKAGRAFCAERNPAITAKTSTYDPLANVDDLTDPSAFEFIATQLNDVNQNQNRAQGALRCVDLTEAIVDIIIETAVQGSSTLEVHIIDPWWKLGERIGQQPAFIDVDDAGLLLPVDVNFPEGTSMWWRLAASEQSIDTTTANLILTFEDRTVSLLRNLGGSKTASNNQTRAQFIASCMKQVPEINFVCPAIKQPAGSVGGNITQGQLTKIQDLASLGLPSALNPNPPPARTNPLKKPGLSRQGKTQSAYWTPNGWKYTQATGGLTPKELSILNPPTNQPDG